MPAGSNKLSADLSRDGTGGRKPRGKRHFHAEQGYGCSEPYADDHGPRRKAGTRNGGDEPKLPAIVGLIFLQVIFVCMVYGPIAAYLVEAFPARIRYTSLSLPYHIGNGVFGGMVPLIGLSTIAATGNIYSGLYYPMAVAAMTFVVGSIALRETHGAKIWEEVEHTPQPAQAKLQDKAA